MKGEWVFIAIAVTGAVVVALAAYWYLSVVFKPCVNQAIYIKHTYG